MKKIFTLAAGLLLTAAVFAADRKPVVTVNSSKNYKIVIDGKSYFGDNLTLRLQDNFRQIHTIQVFQMRRGLFVKGEKQVDRATFKLDRNDVAIRIDWFGNIQIREIKAYGRDDRGFGRDQDKGYDKGQDNGYGKSQDKGNDYGKKNTPAKRF